MNCRAQSAVEYLITTSFLLLITGIIFAYSLFIYTDSVSASTANASVNSLVNTIDQVYALGPETALFAVVSIPANMNAIRVEDTPNGEKSALVFEVGASGGTTQVTRTAQTRFRLSERTQDSLKREGQYRVKVFWNNDQSTTIVVCWVADDGRCIQ